MKIFLKKNEERRLTIGHQWIFSNEIERVEGAPENGEVVRLYTVSGKFLGKGFYNKNSLIAYRHLTDRNEEISREFLFKKISLANSLRKKVNPSKEAYRLVNSESDFLPGLVIDKFDNKFSIQIFSYGMELLKELIKDILIENFKAVLIVEKNDNELRLLEGLKKKESVIYNGLSENETTFITDIDGIKYRIDLLGGQKTGFYLDQSGNRVLLRKYLKENYKVLDLFCNEGGFALNAAYMNLKNITAVDSSKHAIEIATENSKLNNFDGINFICKDVYEFMNGQFQSPDRFDLIILDPPSFAKSRRNVPSALKGYFELNYKAIRLLKPNSLLFTFSCSHHISGKNFEDVLIKSSVEAGRKIQVVEFSNCSYDHPVLPQMKETGYLKGFLLRII